MSMTFLALTLLAGFPRLHMFLPVGVDVHPVTEERAILENVNFYTCTRGWNVLGEVKGHSEVEWALSASTLSAISVWYT